MTPTRDDFTPCDCGAVEGCGRCGGLGHVPPPDWGRELEEVWPEVAEFLRARAMVEAHGLAEARREFGELDPAFMDALRVFEEACEAERHVLACREAKRKQNSK